MEMQMVTLCPLLHDMPSACFIITGHKKIHKKMSIKLPSNLIKKLIAAK